MPKKPPQHLPITALLEALKQKGFLIGVDTYADVQKVLALLGHEPNREELKQSLAAVLATNEAQQQQFSQIYDRLFRSANGNTTQELEAESKPLEEEAPISLKPNQLTYGLAIILAIILAFGTAYYFRDYFIEIDEDLGMKDNTEEVINQDPDDETLKGSGGEDPKSEEKETLKDPGGENPDYEKEKEKPTTPTVQLSYLPLQLPQLNPYKPSWWAEYGVVVQWGLFLAVLLAYALYEYHRWRRLVLAARRKQQKRPPYVWPIEIKENFEVEMPDTFYLLADKMRQRVEDDRSVLNLSQTIQHSIKHWGLFSPVFEQLSRPSEYLVLIDQSSQKNQQASFFEMLAKSMAQNDIYTERFYYKSDPRYCWDSENKARSLKQLLSDYPKHKLLIFGGGQRLLNPSSGKLEEWSNTFEGWEHRALLTPRAIADWGWEEKQLANRFIMQPASVQGMAVLASQLEKGSAAQLDYWQAESAEMEEELEGVTPDIALKRAKRHLGVKASKKTSEASLYTWLQACAIFPELFWDLTLLLGKTLSQQGENQPNLLTQENLRKLTSLSWFQQGYIPAEVRKLLLEELTPKHQYTAAKAIGELLRQNMPESQNVFAYDQRKMHIVVADLLLNPQGKEKDLLLEELAQLQASTPEEKIDFTVVELLDKGKTNPLDFLLDKNTLYQDGKKYQGWRSPFRMGVALFIACACLLLGFLPTDSCQKLAQFEEQEYCIDNPQAEAQLMWLKINSLLKEEVLPKKTYLDSLHQLSRASQDTLLWEANKPLIDYNEALGAYRQGNYQKAVQYEAGADSLQPKAWHLKGLAHFYATQQAYMEETNYYSYDSARYYRDRLGEDFFSNWENENLQTALASIDLTNKYEEVGTLAQQRRFVGRNGKYALMDEQDQLLTEFEFETYRDFSAKSHTPTRQAGKWGLLSRSGEWKALPSYRNIESFETNTALGTVALAQNQSNEWLLIDTLGKQHSKYDRLYPAKEGLRRVEKDGLFGFVDAYNYQEKIAPQYKVAEDFNGGMASVTKGEEAYKINKSNERIEIQIRSGFTPKQQSIATIKQKGYSVQEDQGLLIRIQKNGLWGYADTLEGKVVIPAEYAKAEPFRDGKAIVVTQTDKQQVLDRTGKCLEGCDLPIPIPEMVFVKGGTFTMGCTDEQGSDCEDDEKPAHQVTLSSFEIGKYEVTQAQWQAVMGSNPSKFNNCPQCPVEQVSWDDIQTYIQKLNSQTGETYRLPTEAEWEYAARGGVDRKATKYAGTTSSLGDYAWYRDNSGSKTHPVGQKSPNELGLYDMSGNVYEWCNDWYGDYPSGSQTNPKGPKDGSSRVLRGGRWNFDANVTRVSYRFSDNPGFRSNYLGFRLSKTVTN